MRTMRHPHELVRGAALGAFAVYLVWNWIWLSRGCVPPSILYALTGVPCPTTGCTRSLEALARGDFGQSVLLNPCTLVYVALFGLSLLLMLTRLWRRLPVALPAWLGWAWCAALGLGWIAKLALAFAG